MRRIKIEDLPQDYKVSKEEMRKVLGGVYDYSKHTYFGSSGIGPTYSKLRQSSYDFLQS